MELLLVEDDLRLAAFVSKGLREAGHAVRHLANGRDALYQVAGETFDVILLDRMLPEVDGMTIVQTMRAAGNRTPVLLVSALGEVDDRVEGLRRGGDDYLVKPFAMSELVARVEALGRRPAAARLDEERLELGGLSIDLKRRQARRAGRLVNLTAREFRLLEYLLRHAGQVVSRTMILEAVWDYRFDPQTNVVDQHVSRLRQKIDASDGTSLIETVRGSGYVIRVPERS